ncbi:MAG: hypothetical protein ACHQVS_03405 [Candidatus Babeliales bacterium]
MVTAKKIVTLACLTFACTLPLQAFESSSPFDDLSFMLTEDQDFLKADIPEATMEFTPTDIAFNLVNFNAHKILQNELFLRTNDLNTRDIIYSPLFIRQKEDNYYFDSIVGLHLFYNQTHRMNFTKDSTSINSYLAISEPNLLDAIKESVAIIQKLNIGFNIDPINILPLFDNATIQERKVGLMATMEKNWGRYSLRGIVPLYWVERNLFLTDKEQKAIEQELGVLGKEDQDEFAENHLISDKLGFGDSLVTFDALILNTDDYKIGTRLGLVATVPTAWAFKKGLKGSNFPKSDAMPQFNFGELFAQVGAQNADEVMQNLLFPVVDHLAANILDVDLGNKGHFGLGGIMRNEIPWRHYVNHPWVHNLKWTSSLSLQYMFPNKEKRYYIQKSDVAAFDALNLNNRSIDEIQEQILADPEYAEQVVNLLQTEFVETLYPFVFKTSVFPGVVFQWTPRLMYEGRRLGFDAGADFWIQGPEHLRNINKTPQCPTDLNIDIATKPTAYQTKVLASLFYTGYRDTHDIVVSLNGDKTIQSSGIGKDFTVTLNIEANF